MTVQTLSVVDSAHTKHTQHHLPNAAEYSEQKKHIFDQFCDYTSISGFRFLHSRYPIWFRTVSAIVLFGSMGLFIYHSSRFITRFTNKGSQHQLVTIKAANLPMPSIIVCPMKQFRCAYNGFTNKVEWWYLEASSNMTALPTLSMSCPLK